MQTYLQFFVRFSVVILLKNQLIIKWLVQKNSHLFHDWILFHFMTSLHSVRSGCFVIVSNIFCSLKNPTAKSILSLLAVISTIQISRLTNRSRNTTYVDTWHCHERMLKELVAAFKMTSLYIFNISFYFRFSFLFHI